MVIPLEPDRPRKKINRSFIVQYGDMKDPCAVCGQPLLEGQRARYDPQNRPVHHRHERKEKEAEICPRCFTVKPCHCEV